MRLLSSSGTSQFLDEQTDRRELLRNPLNGTVRPLVERWMNREVSNLDYLLALNALAGRRVGDPNFHPVVPWVVEFNSEVTWRDLKKSKSR